MDNCDKNNPQNCINANLRKATRAVSTLYRAELSGLGLQGTQFSLLSTIGGYTDCTITELAHYLVMDQTTVTRSVQKLQQSGYVELVAGEDRRERHLRLTEQGQQVVQAAYPQWQTAQTALWGQLGDEKAEQLLRLLNEVVELTQS